MTVRMMYSRELLLSLKDSSADMSFPAPNIPVKVARVGNRKKSQSTDAEGPKPPNDNHEELHSDEIGSHPLLRPTKQYNTNADATHRSARQPSESGQSDGSNAALRPADARCGSHGDWSRGCSGWRQRSYSGSERSGLASVRYPQTNHAGRGRGSDDFGLRRRGRGRIAGRYVYPNRGGTNRAYQHGYRPNSCVDSSSPFDGTDDFWLDEDWDFTEHDHDPHQYTKSRERLNSKTFVDPVSPPVTVATESIPTIHETTKQTKAGEEIQNVLQSFSKLRVHSKSCSVDPPPGFDVPPPSLSRVDQSTIADGTPVLDPITSSNWYYVDSKNKIQGPFFHQKMASWLTGGYLPLNIQLRRACDECFITLADHMNLAGGIPFWNGYSQAPITNLNLRSLFNNNTNKVKSEFAWGTNQTAPPPPQPPSTECNATTTAQMPAAAIVNSAAAAAAAAAAVLFATATQSNKNLSIPVSPPPLTQQPTTHANQAGGNSTNNHRPVVCESTFPPLVHDNALLQTNAQSLAVQPSKIEAERHEWANKLAAINSTAATLLASTSNLSPIDVRPATHKTHEPPPMRLQESVPSSINNVQVPPCTDSGSLGNEQEIGLADAGIATKKTGLSNALLTNTESAEVGQLQCESICLPTVENVDSHELLGAPIMEDSPIDATVKKNKKKNKKGKKKFTPEQERQLAWEAEIERRKAVAQEHKLAEEAEARRIAAEEAATLAEEQAAILKEQKRMAKEQRRIESQRSKENSQLEKLRLPQTACWATTGSAAALTKTGVSCGVTAPVAASAATATNQPFSLVAIQAAQASEEVEHKRQATSMAQHIAGMAASGNAANQQRPQAWTPTGAMKENTSAKLALVSSKSLNSKPAPSLSYENTVPKMDYSKIGPTSSSSGVKPPPVVSAGKSAVGGGGGGGGPSIWNLPTDGKTNNLLPTVSKNSKKNKKKSSQKSHEAALFAAKERLAHWCESQLSSLPLSGIDLPTLVDLLCELEAPDQVMEFIETSLGRSAQILKFSKAFLEKRASILNPVH